MPDADPTPSDSASPAEASSPRSSKVAVAIANRLAAMGVMGMLFVCILTAVDVVLRAGFNAPIGGLNEIVQVVMGMAVVSTFPAGLANRVHINVDLLGGFLTKAVRGWLAAAGAILLLLFFLLLAWRVGVHAVHAGARGEASGYLYLPLAPFYWVVTGLLLICLPVQVVVTLARIQDALATSNRKFQFIGIAGIAVFAIATFSLYLAEPATSALSRQLSLNGAVLAFVLFAAMWLLILLLIPLAAAMGLIGILGVMLVVGHAPALSVVGSETTEYVMNANLAVLPLFLLMGSLASVSGLASDIYRLAHAVIGHRSGGLALATIAGCGGFGALTGSSLATTVTIGRIALPEMRKSGYSDALSTGCVAAGGTLGQIVPPSSAIVVYAILTEESIGRLFIAAIIPATIAIALYMITVAICVRLPGMWAPPSKRANFSELIAALRGCTGVFALFAIVVGGIYSGFFTVNEASALGAGVAFLFALFRGRLGGVAFWKVMAETTAATAMIYALIIGAVGFSYFIATTGLTDTVTKFVGDLPLNALGIIAILLLIYLLLGAVMDPFAVMVITVPIVTPLILDLGYDLVWWGIVMVVVVETGLITPPFGINVFVLKGIAEGVALRTVFLGVLPFVAANIVKLILLVLIPGLVIWLPSTMVG